MPELSDELTDRIAGLVERHRSPGYRMRERRAERVCREDRCDRVGQLYPAGVLCPDHAPTHPTPDPASTAAALAERPTPERRLTYGKATTDPLGRTGPLNRHRLPTRDDA